MFKRDNESNGANGKSPVRIGQQSAVRSKNVSVIGPTLVFRGELSADEDLVIEGTIEGTIAHHKKNLTIGPKGRVTADIHASSVLVEGELNGNIHSDGLVSLAKGSIVTGNVACARLLMEDGLDSLAKLIWRHQLRFRLCRMSMKSPANSQVDLLFILLHKIESGWILGRR